jgi:porin
MGSHFSKDVRAAVACAASVLALVATPASAESGAENGSETAAEASAPLDEAAQQTLPTPQPSTNERIDALPQAPARAAPPDPVSLRIVTSQFLDLPVAGDAAETLRFGGKIDAYLDLKGSAFGLDDSIKLHVHPEFKYGESTNGAIGLIPANTQLFYPGDGEVFDLSVNVTKTWKSGTSLTVGKVNILNIATQLPVAGGGGHEGFQNLAMALPPSAIVPGSITGALLNVPTEKALFRLWVFDPVSASRQSGLEDPFGKGVAFLGSVTFPVKLGGKRGYYAIKLAGSTRSEIAAESLPAVLVPAPGSTFGNRKGEFSATLAFAQFLTEYADAPGKGIGVFGQVYLSNGDPTFLDRSGFIGIAGNPRFRPQDKFGVAWFRYSITDELIDVLRTRLPLEDEEGVEAFYTYGLSDRFRMTADVQVVDSAVAFRDVGVTTSLRLTASF